MPGPVTTRLSLTGTLVVARDIAHAKLLERIEAGQGLPDYVKNRPGPALPPPPPFPTGPWLKDLQTPDGDWAAASPNLASPISSSPPPPRGVS